MVFSSPSLFFVTVRVEMVRGTMPNSIQEVRRNSQCFKATNYFVEMISVCESKVSGLCIQQDESVHNIYFVRSGFLFELKNIRAS